MYAMEKVATDIYTFSRLREDGFTYVDKTDVLYAMASGETGVRFFNGLGEWLYKFCEGYDAEWAWNEACKERL